MATATRSEHPATHGDPSERVRPFELAARPRRRAPSKPPRCLSRTARVNNRIRPKWGPSLVRRRRRSSRHAARPTSRRCSRRRDVHTRQAHQHVSERHSLRRACRAPSDDDDALVLLLGALLGATLGGPVVTASTYPPPDPILSLSDRELPPNTPFEATINGCQPGESVTFIWSATIRSRSPAGPTPVRRSR